MLKFEVELLLGGLRFSATSAEKSSLQGFKFLTNGIITTLLKSIEIYQSILTGKKRTSSAPWVVKP